jgi:hypothetical protein
MKFTIKMLLLSMLVFASTNCQKEELVNNSATKKTDVTPTLADVASFESQERLTSAIDAYISGGTLPDELNGISALSKSNTISLKSASDDEAEDEDSLIVSDVFRAFLNPRNEIIVNDVFYRITEEGTFFTPVSNGCFLDTLTTSKLIDNCRQISYIFGMTYETGLYEVSGYDDLYVYDTFNKIDSTKNTSADINLRSASEPAAADFKVTSFKGTFIGEKIDKVFGFSKSVRNYFDSGHRMDAKFYDVDYGVYGEMGVKTKTQKKGWTHLWRKQDVTEIRSGYRVLAMKERLNSPFFTKKMPDDFIKNLAYFTDDDFCLYYYLGYGFTELRNGTYLTLNFYKKDPTIDYDLIKSLINFAKRTKIEDFDDYYKNGKVAVRFADNVTSTQKTIICMLNQEKVGTNTDKVTYIVDKKRAGVKITLKFSSDFSDFTATPGYISVKDNLEYYEGTQMYGVAKKDDVWKGVLFNF